VKPISNDPPRAAGVCVITDGAMGNERQALALAGAMGLAPVVHRIRLRAPWRWSAPKLTAGVQLALPDAQLRALTRPWPLLAIGCGRHAALITRSLRQWSGGATFTVQILDPRVDLGHFDLVIAPRHDSLQAWNVIQTLGALNPIDDAWLDRAAAEFATLCQLPQPRTALLVGGPRRGLGLDDAWFERLIGELERWRERDGGSLLITASRRTPAAWRERLRAAFRSGCTCFWGGAEDGTNPYPGYLAVADRIVVTPDSVNMLSEACATGVPVFTSLPAVVPVKLAAFHAELADQGWLHDIHVADVDVNRSTLRQPAPLREIAAVASKVWHRIEATRPDVGAALDRSV
jgi:mitochondrial fission protein ELM1